MTLMNLVWEAHGGPWGQGRAAVAPDTLRTLAVLCGGFENCVEGSIRFPSPSSQPGKCALS